MGSPIPNKVENPPRRWQQVRQAIEHSQPSKFCWCFENILAGRGMDEIQSVQIRRLGGLFARIVFRLCHSS